MKVKLEVGDLIKHVRIGFAIVTGKIDCGKLPYNGKYRYDFTWLGITDVGQTGHVFDYGFTSDTWRKLS